VHPDNIEYIQGDTDKVFFGEGTGGSRSATMSGSAFYNAGEKVIAKAKAIAAHNMKVDVADINFNEGIFSSTKTNQTTTIKDVAQDSFNPAKLPKNMEAGLYATAVYKADVENFPNGVHICEVEIDPETGVSKVVRYTTVDDVGIAVNPMLVTGQVHGGVAQGIGQALYEGVAYSEEGQLLTASYQDYCVPRADDIPPIIVTLDDSAPCRTNPLGAKGCGESGAIGGPPCVTNGVMDALSELGIKQLNTPLTPAKVWQAIRDARAGV
jgi:aerobic carbon-monoxide dehydrogenase large subunit